MLLLGGHALTQQQYGAFRKEHGNKEEDNICEDSLFMSTFGNQKRKQILTFPILIAAPSACDAADFPYPLRTSTYTTADRTVLRTCRTLIRVHTLYPISYCRNGYKRVIQLPGFHDSETNIHPDEEQNPNRHQTEGSNDHYQTRFVLAVDRKRRRVDDNGTVGRLDFAHGW